MTRRHCGIDLNGWRDSASRSWTIVADGEECEQPTWIDGGFFGSLVRIEDDTPARWIGGFQAALAPHGRGPGWGEVGRAHRRVAIRDLLRTTDLDIDQASAALSALGKDATHAVMAIDDTPESDETVQERLLAAMHRAGLRRRLLVWRPVLAVLALLRDRPLEDGARVGVINHARSGMAIQTLRIRQKAGRMRPVLAPERREAGLVTPSDAGYEGLERAAAEAVDTVASNLPPCETPRAIGRLALGLPAPPEMLRTDRGRWTRLEPPPAIPVPPVRLSRAAGARLGACDLIVFESLTTGALRRGLHARLGDLLGRDVIDLPSTGVADGGLEAARRLAVDDPVYFDFLPQISTIVTGSRGAPTSYDLIEPEATLPAGRTYRSGRPARLGLEQGQDRLSVFLKKETAQWPRKARIELGTTVERAAPVDLFVEQAPLTGSARIVLRSPALSRQHIIDWAGAEELRQDWASVIAGLETPTPTIPKRLVLPCGPDPWHDSASAPGLLSLLDTFDGSASVDWQALAQRLAARPDGRYCISSDGEIPADVPSAAIEKLDRLTQRAVEEEFARFDANDGTDNERLRFLLWQFRRCPGDIVDRLIDAVADRSAWRRLFPHWAHWKLILQGIGRCAHGTETEDRILRAVFARPGTEWKWWGENACVSFLLSRSDTGPRHLGRAQVETAAEAVIRNFEANRGTDFTTFFYAPFLLAGLLRWRLVQPRALVAGHDVVADALARVVRETLPDLEARARAVPNLNKYVTILRQILEELQGTGSNPELLLDIAGREDMGAA